MEQNLKANKLRFIWIKKSYTWQIEKYHKLENIGDSDLVSVGYLEYICIKYEASMITHVGRIGR